jgi:hypothetical protein
MFDAVLEDTANFFVEHLKKDVKITKIDQSVLKAWADTWKIVNTRQPPNGGWDWEYKNNTLHGKYKKNLMGIAVWGEDNSLCGLALCTKSKGNEVLSIHYIEGSPNENHPLKGYVFTIIDTVLLQYGGLIKSNSIRIIDPVDTLISFYTSFGYKLNKKLLFHQKYCEKGMPK